MVSSSPKKLHHLFQYLWDPRGTPLAGRPSCSPAVLAPRAAARSGTRRCPAPSRRGQVPSGVNLFERLGDLSLTEVDLRYDLCQTRAPLPDPHARWLGGVGVGWGGLG